MPVRSRFTVRSCCSLLVFAVGLAARGQCPNPQWLPGEGVSGADLYVESTILWDRDGAGPAPALVVVGGGFNVVGTVASRGLAAWNPATGEWLDIAPDLYHPSGFANIASLAVLNDGRLVASGGFESIDGVAAIGIAVYDGTTWSPFGDGFNGPDGGAASAMLVMPNGDLVAAGYIPVAGSVLVNGIARWNGTAWSALGSGVDLGQGEIVEALALRPSGTLIAAGYFSAIGGAAAQSIAQWNGSAWTALPGGGVNGSIFSLAVMTNGDVVAGGGFSTAGGQAASDIARWNGSTWSAMGAGPGGGIGGYVNTLMALPGNQLLAAGNENPPEVSPFGVLARWNGSAWVGMNGQLPFPNFGSTFTRLTNGDVVLGGQFTGVGGSVSHNLAKWNGSSWSGVAAGGLNDWIDELSTQPDGSVIAGGAFTTIGNKLASKVARWNGTAWQAMPGIRVGFTRGAATLANGRVVTVGDFDLVSSPESFMAMAEWDGTTWNDIGSNVDRAIYNVIGTPDGSAIVTGEFGVIGGISAGRIARYDGSQFTTLGEGLGIEGDFGAGLGVLSNGDLVVGGAFQTAGGASASNIARWNGASWAALGDGLNDVVWALTVGPNGQVYVTGAFTASGASSMIGVARWDGAHWHAMGSGVNDGQPLSIHAHTSGDVFLAGQFTSIGGSNTKNIARWDGSAWHGVGLGIDSGTGPFEYSTATGLATGPGDQVLVGGQFLRAGGTTSVNFARWGCNVPACYADCDGTGSLDIDDFICFQTFFAIGDAYADCDQSGDLTIDDFICFQTLFAVGC